MDKTKLMQRLMATFLEELEDHVRTLNQDLLALEKNPSPEERAQRLKTLFRTAHSLKGAARSVNVHVIEGACHRLEEILSAARDSQLPLSAELFALLFASADAMEEAAMRLREQQDLTGAPLAALLPRLDAAVTGTPAPPAAQVPSLSPAPEPAPPSETPRPSVTPSPPHPVIPSSRRPLPSPPTPAASEPPDAVTTVRVPAEKLDTLLARIGELLVARRRVEGRVNDIKTLGDFVTQWKTEWHRVEKLFDKFLRHEEESPTTNGHTRTLPRRAGVILRQTGENLRRLEKDLETLGAAMAGDGRLLRQVAGPLDDEVRRVRMLPFAEACQGLDRVVRDLAHAGGKEVDLVIEGGSVELDRSVLEGLKDPLRHLVRNAVDHGAETPDKRRAAGKPPRARIKVAAALRGAQVEVVVADDGRGLDLEALREQARKRRLPDSLDERQLAQLVFLPGLSTSRIITDVSGRGVGLDVVKSRVETLHGTVDLAHVAGGGTRFTLIVPLTLTTLRAVLVGVAGQTFAFAGTNVHKLVRAKPADLRSVAGRDMLAFAGTPLPLASLAAVLGLNPQPVASLLARPANGSPSRGAPSPDQRTLPVLVIAAGEKRMAFAVDEFLAEQEILIKNLGARIRRLRHVSGATLLPSGKIALVLNAANLVRTALGRAPAHLPVAEGGEAPAVVKKRLLVVDDSVTTRTLEKSILEAAGYEVTTAVDGKAAWQRLQEQPPDLIVSDVEMPQMDGFELTQAVRSSKQFRDLPIVLVTARESEQDKTRGIEAGADAYLVKSAFDQKNLLETIAQLLEWTTDYGLLTMIRVLIADDSPTSRALLKEILGSDPELQVVGEARDGLEAVELTLKLRPDVVTMDIRMPHLDGFEATKEIMITAPTPIVIVTGSIAIHDVETSIHTLRAGALGVYAKPPGPGAPAFEEEARQLIANVKSMAQVKVVRHWRPVPGETGASKRVDAGTAARGGPRRRSTALTPPSPKGRVVAIATSTGGPAALQRLFSDLPGDFPVPILVVQHITRGFTAGLADWLNKVSSLHVKVAQEGERLVPHTVYLAPDNQHLGVSNRPAIALSSAAPVGGFRPSGTFLFESAARAFGAGTVAVIMTGMGEDGVAGLQSVRQASGAILAQDEKSSVIFGMPGAAVAAGLADAVLPLDTMAARLVDLVESP